MHTTVYYIAIFWLLCLFLALVVYTFCTPHMVHRILALDTLTLVLILALATVAIQEEMAGFLDIALALAALGFVQTVGTARLVAYRKDLR